MDTQPIIEPGRYDYDLTVTFPSVYIPDHTPPAFRNEYAQQTTRRRYASGQFDLSEHVSRDLLRNHFVRQICEDVSPSDVTVVQFGLTRITN